MAERVKVLRADELAELFRDMADFAQPDEARRVLLIAAKTVDELKGVYVPEDVIEIFDEKKVHVPAPKKDTVPFGTNVQGGGTPGL